MNAPSRPTGTAAAEDPAVTAGGSAAAAHDRAAPDLGDFAVPEAQAFAVSPAIDHGTPEGDDFAVDRVTNLVGGLVERFPKLFLGLGRLETKLLDRPLPRVERPVFIAGLARSGSTMLLELLSWHAGVVTHRYRDFPVLHAPILWNRLVDRAAGSVETLRERAHRDGILVNRESPEAFEEVLWMAFFRDLHDPQQTNVMEAGERHPAFEAFYREHIRKLLWLRHGRHYVSKGNYNVARLGYLQTLFPDARFVVPVRDPQWHVASLMKQHQLFLDGQRRHPESVDHLRRAGHFEFGLDRRPINTGDGQRMRTVMRCWEDGREVEGWARYWSMVYDHVLDRIEASPALARATLLVPYEALCREPVATVSAVYAHCGLEQDGNLLERARRRLHFPEYYAPDASAEDQRIICEQTERTRRRLDALLGAGRS